MTEDKKELEQIAGISRAIEIQGKLLKVAPLRLREIIALEQFREEEHVEIENLAYSVFLHLRENTEFTFEDMKDMEMADVTKIREFCDAVLYPEKKKDDDDSKND